MGTVTVIFEAPVKQLEYVRQLTPNELEILLTHKLKVEFDGVEYDFFDVVFIPDTNSFVIRITEVED